MNKIKIILKEELKKESNNYLIESLKPLSVIKDKDVLIEHLTIKVFDLIDKGYSIDEIGLVLEQNTTVTPTLTNKETGKFNLWNTIFGGSKSMFVEQLIKWFLQTVLGVNDKYGQMAAIFISEYPNPFHLFRLFKNQRYCTQEATKLVPALLEVIINNYQFNGGEQEPLGKGFLKVELRNIIFQAIKQSNADDIIGYKICEYIWKEKEQ